MRKQTVLFFLALSMCLPYAVVAAPYKLPDTGQTLCYQTAGPFAEITCADTGQDGAYIINPMNYTDNGNGTVSDHNTGLMWQKCAVGRNNDNTCSGASMTFNWYLATGTYNPTYNANSLYVCGLLELGNYSDWRLPTRKELETIIDYSVPYPGPAIKTEYFPNTDPNRFWSSPPLAFSTFYAWGTDFSNGAVRYYDKISNYYIRCVRGDQPVQKLVKNGNGTVTDSGTGLTWQQEEPGAMMWGYALSYCEDLYLGGYSDWRLPNIRELESLADDTRYSPTVDISYFPNAYSNLYLTSTNYAYDHSSEWDLLFQDGIVGNGLKTYSYHVRCVRGGEDGSIVPVWIHGTTEYFSSIQESHDAADDGATIWAMAADFSESVVTNKSITLKGGFDANFNSTNSYTTLHGELTILSNSLTLENLQIY